MTSTLSTNLWRYHTKPNQLIGSNRLQLRTMVCYMSGEMDVDDFPKAIHSAAHQDPYLQKTMSEIQDIDDSVFYAVYIANKRLPEFETKLIQDIFNHDFKDSKYSISKYIKHFFKGGHWPEMEQAVIKNLKLKNIKIKAALYYMLTAELKSWPDLEKILLDLPEGTYDELRDKNTLLVDYARQADRRWPEAEPTILREGAATLLYIHYVIGAPWPAGEPTLVKTNYTRSYLQSFPERREALMKLGYRDQS